MYGKFSQFSGNVPYAAFIQALKQLMQQLLSESEERLRYWRELLGNAVGRNGQVIVDVIPEFELIVGMYADCLTSSLIGISLFFW